MRRSLIAEALSWGGGTLDNPRKYLIAKLPNGQTAYFLKPGKEVAKQRPNPHDMTPVVGRPEHRLRFDEIWAYLSKTAIINPEIFKAVLTLIYRDAFLLDHMRVGNSVRYQPNKEIVKSIRDMDQEIGSVLPFGLMGLLHFLDLLGWNEDVKYHTENDEPTFKGKYRGVRGLEPLDLGPLYVGELVGPGAALKRGELGVGVGGHTIIISLSLSLT